MILFGLSSVTRLYHLKLYFLDIDYIILIFPFSLSTSLYPHFYRSSSGHHTLGRLPSHQQSNYMAGPNNGKYATLSKQCKTLEANDFY